MKDVNRPQPGDYDVSVVYDIRELPDVKSGRCDNCDTSKFNSSIKGGVFLRKCSECGLTKRI
ncbi:hypothetical protein KLEB271_gp97 [Bacillus phage vB_BauS_KLEB27-1]|uniref:DUF8096 domain-containing protein n=1 Tax=Bacillus pumilus TaxID=1408 RepID=A0AAE3WLC7_BACPU|nr:hypothetical protein [Bacillus pumilus]MCY7724097.1 hypothetical protein [Bacillus pumilus]MCY7747414.1 hypothetical protein [Bacillus pumilus]MDR4250728.1 hypothetical protein [Bacillus pumilus]UNY40691.1 hypothetical protein KLEB271_gp97 [Bacillus phage vB_BauS_KLEB27-1]